MTDEPALTVLTAPTVARGRTPLQKYALVEHLYRLADEREQKPASRAALAALRRGVGKEPGEAAEMFSHVVPYLPENVSTWGEGPYYLIAALFAWQTARPKEGNGRQYRPYDPHSRFSLGAAFAEYVRQEERGERGRDARAATERRFAALLDSDGEELAAHLRYAVQLLAAVPLDWHTLLRDVQRWDAEGRFVQRTWARDFYRQTAADDGAGDTAPEAPTGTEGDTSDN